MPSVRIGSWNVNSIRTRLPHLSNWLEQFQPDVLALQETKVIDPLFPIEAINALGYQALFSGQKSYNGVALLSKQPMRSITDHFAHFEDPQKRLQVALYQDICIVNVYIPMGESLISDKYQYKLKWYDALHTQLKDLLQTYPQLIVLGDFNVAPYEEDVYDPLLWQDRVLVSPKERQAWQKIIQLGLHDSFRLFPQDPDRFSWWDYRQGAFYKNHGLRIDHILISDALKLQCQASLIDQKIRAQPKPSDHAPVYIDLNID